MHAVGSPMRSRKHTLDFSCWAPLGGKDERMNNKRTAWCVDNENTHYSSTAAVVGAVHLPETKYKYLPCAKRVLIHG